MPALAKREAIARLTQAAQRMSPDDLLEFHNELFPESPESQVDPNGGVDAVARKVADYLRRGLEVEEILDLWNVAFPGDWNVSYDDETDTIHYLEVPQSIPQAD